MPHFQDFQSDESGQDFMKIQLAVQPFLGLLHNFWIQIALVLINIMQRNSGWRIKLAETESM